MNATVSTRERAWQLADKLFPTDYMKDEHDSLRAGYPVFNTTSTDDKYTGFHISDLNTALELNMGAETIRIRKRKSRTTSTSCFSMWLTKESQQNFTKDRNTTTTATDRLVAGTGRRNRMKHIRRNGTTSSFRCTH